MPETLALLDEIAKLSGRPVSLQPDGALGVKATFSLARATAPLHVLKYRPDNDPLDYWVAYQACVALRLFSLPSEKRFDLAATGLAQKSIKQLLSAGLKLTPKEETVAAPYVEVISHWTMMNLRSFPGGMRIDTYLSKHHPHLKELQRNGIAQMQAENHRVLSMNMGRMRIPPVLMAPLAAYALHSDRLLGNTAYAVPYSAIGALKAGHQLLALSDSIPESPEFDKTLTDAWANEMGVRGWYDWVPYVLNPL
ncbi:hypothetical protein LC612_35830 [Nostoc sp. CHAB 5834]|nr:hypothetical protein [Nostoc sp. CHAB 5834]